MEEDLSWWFEIGETVSTPFDVPVWISSIVEETKGEERGKQSEREVKQSIDQGQRIERDLVEESYK